MKEPRSSVDTMTKTGTTQAATLTYNDKVIELPIRSGSTGANVIDVGTVYRDRR